MNKFIDEHFTDARFQKTNAFQKIIEEGNLGIEKAFEDGRKILTNDYLLRTEKVSISDEEKQKIASIMREVLKTVELVEGKPLMNREILPHQYHITLI